MNEVFKKLTEEIKTQLKEAFSKKEAREFIEKTKGAQDTGNFEVVVSTIDIDRQGESIDQSGWDLVFYKMNPVVLWAHDYWSLPIGVTDEIDVQDGKLVAKGRFAPEDANPFAQQVRRLYDLKIVRATSVGFITKEQEGGKIKSAELLEFSFVPVPANPLALSLRKAQKLGLDLAMLATKGLKLDVHVAAEGDECEMPDGTMGEMHPNDEGEIVCMPKKAKQEPKEGDACELEDGTEGELKPNDEGVLVCVPKVTEKPEETEEYIRIPVKDADNYDPDSIRTITISEDEGIKALSACPKGEFEGGKCNVGVEIITYLFDKEKWTEEQAREWIEEHEKAKTEKNQKQIGEIVGQLKETIAALEFRLQGSEPEGGGKANPRGETKVESAGLERVKADLEIYHATRNILRAVDIAVEEGLRKLKNFTPDQNRN